ncbi:N-acetylglucosamine-6-phosphate deacetylase [Dinghuibacter silviterrae]|uniref:N-acetylglucosamine 6-phosphate deacetylase n=1 Tax=Dinghuibacter silviterrae TaxID=1539049 RepID=A0A4R8DQA1_9BACT|nr:N-acetylglucosamine-6-phosphate deacetylase [Dinghuibacter silviterrae]TDW99574.1 N-acetylglucosamine 6-phosphate deacetylase [Dinghuibacter silviterrae]
MKTIFYNGTIHTGTKTLTGHVLVTAGATIREIRPAESLAESPADGYAQSTAAQPGAGSEPPRLIDLAGGHLAPAFIDLQLYGGLDHLFSDHPSVTAIDATYRYCLQGGAAYFQPTMATQTDALMEQAIAAVRAYKTGGGKGVLGLHLEGPYINPVKRGAHREEYIQRPDAKKLQALLDKSGGFLTMMTLAPERCDEEIVRQLAEAGVVVSAGHTNATYEEAQKGFSWGIPAATHLFNAMSPLSHRAPGMVGALLHDTPVPVSVVADGHHVDFAVIAIAKRLLGEKLFLITDAVTENQQGSYQHQLQGDKYILPDGTLSGSALTMIKAVQNCVEHIGIPLDEALRMASLYPARVMGLEARLGTIAPNKEATLVWFDDNYEVKKVFVSGEPA